MNRVQAQIKPEHLIGIRFSLEERRGLAQLLQGGKLRNRRLCVDWLRRGELVRGNRAFIFEMCAKLIPDRSEHVRWGAFSILGEYAQTHPKQLWPLVIKWGSVPSKDIRDGVACCILEHIFEYHFGEFFAKAMQHASQEPRFAYTIQE
jgi:hypothetical protein